MGEANLMIMRGIKKVFDPKGILNPGKDILGSRLQAAGYKLD